MSLLTKISELFSNKQNKQLLGIALQQQGISLCVIPVPEQGAVERPKPLDNIDASTPEKINLLKTA